MRKLVTIQKIIEITPIEGADRISTAMVLGWRCVIPRGEHKVGELIVFAEIDSVFPEGMKEVDFLKESKWRVRTRKFKSQISQGLVLPLSVLNGKKFPEDTRENPIYEWKEGQEVTSLLGVQLYVPYLPPNIAGEVKGAFPGFLIKSDQTRAQILRPLLEKYKGIKCSISEKIDGCLHYRTFIKTDKGDINIGKIVNQKLKVKVYSYNSQLDKIELKEIEKFYRYPSKSFMRIGISHRKKGNKPKFIECTSNHHFWTGKLYKKAQDLIVGETCYQFADGIDEEIKSMILPIKIVSIEKNFKPQTKKISNNKYVYDLTIRENHNYFADGILTHNSSVTLYIKDGEFGVCSRNLELKETVENSLWKLARKYDIENKLRQLGKNVALQSEIVGPGINKNTLALTYVDLYFYDAFNIDTYKYYDLNDFKELVENKLKLKTVPILSYDFILIDNIDELVKLSIGPSKINPKGPREGIVVRPIKEIYDLTVMEDNAGRVTFKVVNPLYLLKNEK